MNFYLHFEWSQVIGTTRDQKLLTGNTLRNQNSSFYTSFENLEIYSYYQGNKLSSWSGWSVKNPNHHNHLFLVILNNPITKWRKAITFDYWASIACPFLYDIDKYKNQSIKARFEALSIARIGAFKNLVEEGTSAFDCFTFEYWDREFNAEEGSIASKEIFDNCWEEYKYLFLLLDRDHKRVQTLKNDLCEWENQKDRTIWHLDHKPIVKEYP